MRKNESTAVRLARETHEAIARVINRTYRRTPELWKLKSATICIRCAYDKKTQSTPGVACSHTSPRNYLADIADQGCVYTANFVRRPDGLFDSHKESIKTASALPLFCTGTKDSCETFFSENGEATPPEIFSEAFYKSCGVFCERLAFAEMYRITRQRDGLMAEWKQELPLVERKLKEAAARRWSRNDKVALRAVKDIGDQQQKVVEAKHRILENAHYNPAQAVEWARRVAAGDHQEMACFCLLFETPPPWVVGEMSYLARREGVYHWFFTLTMKVSVKGVKKYALVFIPVMLSGPPGTSMSIEEEAKAKAELSEWMGKMRRHWSNQRKNMAMGICALSLSRELLWYAADMQSDVAKMTTETLETRVDGSAIFEEALDTQLREPDGDAIMKVLAGRPNLLAIVEKVLRDGKWMMRWKTDQVEDGDNVAQTQSDARELYG